MSFRFTLSALKLLEELVERKFKKILDSLGLYRIHLLLRFAVFSGYVLRLIVLYEFLLNFLNLF